jgi:uncharacterized protein
MSAEVKLRRIKRKALVRVLGLGCCVRCACARWHSADTQPAWRGGCERRWQRDGQRHVKLCDAAKHSEVAEIERLVAAGADPNLLVRQWTPLLWAATHGHAAPIAALVAAGARVNGANSMGSTPLMSAAANDRAVAIDALLAAGADVHHANVFGEAPLHRASMRCQVDAARILLDAGARTDVRNDNGKRPIDVVRELCMRWWRRVVAPRRCTVVSPLAGHRGLAQQHQRACPVCAAGSRCPLVPPVAGRHRLLRRRVGVGGVGRGAAGGGGCVM